MPNVSDGKTAKRAPSQLQNELGWLYLFAKDMIASKIKEDRTKESLDKATAKLEKHVEREINNIHAKIADLGEAGAHLLPGCKKGCWFCCTHLVTATVPEVIHIANTIRANWSPDQIAALKERIAKHKAAMQPVRNGQSDFAPRHACPLLQHGACTVWMDRPLICRGWNSVKVEECEAKYQDPASGIRERALAHQVAVADFVRQGLEEGLATANLSGDVCELAFGLEIALDNPDAAERYLAGEDIFAPARAGLDQWT